MLLQIRVMSGKNSSLIHTSTSNAEIHSTDPVPEITIPEATQRHDNYTDWLVK